MINTLNIRGIKFGEGKPKVCVSLIGASEAQVVTQAKEISRLNIEVIEWRMDYFEGIGDSACVTKTLRAIREAIGEKILLATFRSKKEGGEAELTIEAYTALYRICIASKLVDLIDIEFFTQEEVVKALVAEAHEQQMSVIISSHDFEKTPAKEEIISRLCKMQALGADIPKMAVMPHNLEDVLTLLSATEEMNRNYAHTPIITMSMGKLGLVSRLSGQVFGSALTFGAYMEASAPGQIAVGELTQALGFIDKYQ